MDRRKKYEEDVKIEIIEEEEMTAKEVDLALEHMAERLIDDWLKKNNVGTITKREQTI
ncbi:MAG: hypothetical protein HZB59_10165 [Ignavibacteriales bacterium]|nr:hypothetical protein [Ignavibacteriales bacterium]